MAVCKECGKAYRPTAESPGCPTCGSKARARPRPSAAEAPAESDEAEPEAEPEVEAEAEPEAKRPAPAAVPRRRLGPQPAPQPTPRAAAAPSAAPRPAAKVAHGGGAAPAKSARPAPHRESAPREAPQHVPHRPPGEAPLLDDVARNGLLAALGFAIVVGLVLFFVFRAKAADRRAHEAYEAEVTGLYNELRGLDLNDPAAAERLVDLAGKKEDTWKDHALAAEITSLVARARSNLTASKERREALSRFTDVEDELKKGAVASDRLKELRRQLDESEVALSEGGAELVARIGLAHKTADQMYATQILAEARKARDDGAGPRPSMVRFQSVEEELKGLLDRAFTTKNTEQQAFYTPLYQQAIEDSDKLATALFKAEGENMQWVDCLAPPQDKLWNPSSVRGFSHRVEGGVLQIVGPDADAAKMAVVSIGDREQWRHLQLEVEFVIEKGDLDLIFRLGRGPNPNTVTYPLRTVGGPLKAGKKYSARFNLVGSQLNVRFAGEDIDTPSPHDEALPWTKNRKGAIGFVVQPEARVRFTRFRVRELR